MTDKELDNLEDNIEEILEHYKGYVYDYIIEEIKKVPKQRQVKCSCGVAEKISILDILFVCPMCNGRQRLRAFGPIGSEIYDVIDAAKDWLKRTR